MQRRTTALYFSPTGGTRTYVRAVAAAMPHMGGEVDLTGRRSGAKFICSAQMM